MLRTFFSDGFVIHQMHLIEINVHYCRNMIEVFDAFLSFQTLAHSKIFSNIFQEL